jgi:hypothetical protein
LRPQPCAPGDERARDTGLVATSEERRTIVENIKRVFEHHGRKVEFA